MRMHTHVLCASASNAHMCVRNPAVAKKLLMLVAPNGLCRTLNHSMGMGFGVMAALSSGASLVLPAPAPDADLTVAAIRDEQCVSPPRGGATVAYTMFTSCCFAAVPSLPPSLPSPHAGTLLCTLHACCLPPSLPPITACWHTPVPFATHS